MRYLDDVLAQESVSRENLTTCNLFIAVYLVVFAFFGLVVKRVLWSLYSLHGCVPTGTRL